MSARALMPRTKLVKPSVESLSAFRETGDQFGFDCEVLKRHDFFLH
jgi:hypothetical protein